MGERNARAAWQPAGQGRHQGTHLGGKPARRTGAGQVVEAAALFPSTSPFAHQTIADSKGESNRLCAPIGMGMSAEQDVGTHALGLRRGMRTKKPLEVDDVGRGQLNGWVLTQECTSLKYGGEGPKRAEAITVYNSSPPPFLPEEMGLSAECICDWEY